MSPENKRIAVYLRKTRMNIHMYPCNRGNKYGLDRGYHHETGPYGVVVCKTAATFETTDRPQPPTATSPGTSARCADGFHPNSPQDAHPSYYYA